MTPENRAVGKPLTFIKPMLPTLVDAPPKGDGWTHEIKYDGYRTELIVDRDEAGAFTRNGHDWTDRYRVMVDAAAALLCSTAIIDGEVVVQDDVTGVTDFQALRSAIAGEPHRLTFMAFDLVHLNGVDLRPLPLEERRRRLEDLIGAPDETAAIHFSESVDGDGAPVFALAEELGLEGIVSTLHVKAKHLRGVGMLRHASLSKLLF